jgi:predicted SnoaL-like aldol condensation-catalyzing enzyme
LKCLLAKEYLWFYYIVAGRKNQNLKIRRDEKVNFKLTALVAIIAIGVTMVGCTAKKTSKEEKDKMIKENKIEVATSKLTNKEKVVELLKSIETGAAEPVGYINPNKYIQHNLSAEDGLAGFGKLLQALPKGSAKVNTVRAFEDGNYVIAQTEYNFFGPKAGFDIFRFEDDKIVEHWDNLQEIAGPNPSGHTMFDGTTEIKDLNKTEANKEFVKSFVQDVLMGKNPEKLADYFNGDNYIQHNPSIADNLSGLGAALKAMADQGVEMKYDKIHMTFGQGNFVLVVSEGSFAGKHTSYYDLFRVENNKIAEHWDVMESILPKEQWMNQNGKY